MWLWGPDKEFDQEKPGSSTAALFLWRLNLNYFIFSQAQAKGEVIVEVIVEVVIKGVKAVVTVGQILASKYAYVMLKS